MVRSREEVRKLVRWPRVGRVQRLRLPAESRGENRLHKPDAVLSPGRRLQQPRALPRTAPQIDPLQPGTLEFPESQLPPAQARWRNWLLLPAAGISRQGSVQKHEGVR